MHGAGGGVILWWCERGLSLLPANISTPPLPPSPYSCDHASTPKLCPGGFSLGEAKQRNCTLARNRKTHRGRPFQPANDGWSVPTKKCGYFEVNLSLSLCRSLLHSLIQEPQWAPNGQKLKDLNPLSLIQRLSQASKWASPPPGVHTVGPGCPEVDAPDPPPSVIKSYAVLFLGLRRTCGHRCEHRLTHGEQVYFYEKILGFCGVDKVQADGSEWEVTRHFAALVGGLSEAQSSSPPLFPPGGEEKESARPPSLFRCLSRPGRGEGSFCSRFP